MRIINQQPIRIFYVYCIVFTLILKIKLLCSPASISYYPSYYNLVEANHRLHFAMKVKVCFEQTNKKFVYFVWFASKILY